MAKKQAKEENLEFQEKLKSLEAKFGKGSIVKANTFDTATEVASTGSLTLDKATGIGGIPKGGKITQIVGLNQASKTTLLLTIIREDQKKTGRPSAFLDIEGTLDINYAKNIGCDLDNLYIINPSNLNAEDISGEEWLNICAEMIATDQFSIIGVDSIAALVPKSEFQGADTAGIGKLSRMLSQGFRLITAKLLRSSCGLVLLNQYRIAIGSYGNPYVESGGESLKYYTSMKIELSKSLDKDTEGVHGIVVKAKVTKNKFSNPYLAGEYYVQFGKGLIEGYEIMNLAIEKEIIEKSGNTYSHSGTKLGVGLNQLETFLTENPEVLEEIKEKVLESLSSEPKEVIEKE